MTHSPVTLGVDLGTSGVKVVALDVHRRTVASVTRPYPLSTPRAGWTEQDPHDWVQGTLAALTAVAAQLREQGQTPVALGLSGQMHGAVFLGAQGEVIRPAPLWNDQRTGQDVAEIEARIPRSELIARTGNRAVTGFQLPKILWLRREEPGAFARLRHVLLPKDYLGLVLTGQMITEPSDASGVGALHLARKEWDTDVLGALDLSPALFPSVVNSWEVAGHLKGPLAAQTGLPLGLPVVAGAGDNAAAGVALGLGSARPEVGSLSLGTSGVLFAPLAQPTPDPEGRVHLFAHADGGYHLLGVTLSCAGALQWLRDRLFPEVDFERLLREAEQVQAGGESPVFLPYLAGERSPHMNPALRGVWTGLSLAHGRGHLTRALLEGTAFALADVQDVMVGLSSVRSVLATGGGARSDLWLGLMAHTLGLDVHRPPHVPGPAQGAALLAMPAAGFFPDLTAALPPLGLTGMAGVTPVEPLASRAQYATVFGQVYGSGPAVPTDVSFGDQP